MNDLAYLRLPPARNKKADPRREAVKVQPRRGRKAKRKAKS